MRRISAVALLTLLVGMSGGCDETLLVDPTLTPSATIADDAALYRHITVTEPLNQYALFPDAEAMTEGQLSGSSAHRRVVRVRLNGRALSALQAGRLPRGTWFPDGSVIVKEIFDRDAATPHTYSVMYKALRDSRAGNGWLWAEFNADGSVHATINNRGAQCTSCHQLVEGSFNDSVRTFERQQ